MRVNEQVSASVRRQKGSPRVRPASSFFAACLLLVVAQVAALVPAAAADGPAVLDASLPPAELAYQVDPLEMIFPGQPSAFSGWGFGVHGYGVSDRLVRSKSKGTFWEPNGDVWVRVFVDIATLAGPMSRPFPFDGLALEDSDGSLYPVDEKMVERDSYNKKTEITVDFSAWRADEPYQVWLYFDANVPDADLAAGEHVYRLRTLDGQIAIEIDTKMTEEMAEHVRANVDTVPDESAPAAQAPSAAPAPESLVADCSPFGDFDEAQAYYAAHPDAQPIIDPNWDGRACEVWFGVDAAIADTPPVVNQSEPVSSTSGGGGGTAGGGPIYTDFGGLDGVDLDCYDFASPAEAQAYFNADGGSVYNNADGLDRNHNGLACELGEFD